MSSHPFFPPRFPSAPLPIRPCEGGKSSCLSSAASLWYTRLCVTDGPRSPPGKPTQTESFVQQREGSSSRFLWHWTVFTGPACVTWWLLPASLISGFANFSFLCLFFLTQRRLAGLLTSALVALFISMECKTLSERLWGRSPIDNEDDEVMKTIFSSYFGVGASWYILLYHNASSFFYF